MAPRSIMRREIRNTAAERQAEKQRRRRPTALVLLLLDVFDNLGHVVLVFAELGGIFEQLFILLFGFFDRHRLLFVFGRIRLLRLGLGVELVGPDRLQLLLDRRGGARPARSQERLRIKGRAAFWADHRLAQQIVITRSATRT